MNGACFLGSYPKSGNTWVRVLLANLLSDVDHARPINNLDLPTADAAARATFDDVMGLDSSDLTASEVSRLLPDFLRRITANSADSERGLLVKLHYANRTTDGVEILPSIHNGRAIYVARHPLSVAASLSRHLNVTDAQAAQHMADDAFHFNGAPHRMSRLLPQWLGSWSTHVATWLATQTLPVMLVRYEDLWTNTKAELHRIAAFLGLEHRLHRVSHAIACSSLAELRAAERLCGFRERPRAMLRFFGRGGYAAARERLSRPLAEAIVERHADAMSRLGYGPFDA